MRPVLAIARQTFWEGIRMRIVLVSLIVLAVLLVRFVYVRGDETLTGRLQNFLAYSFGALGLFASLATVFFSCATLAGEIRNCQIHMVVTKPVSRFQILLGKWLGVNALNLLIVVICGVAIYAFARQIAGGKEQFQRDRLNLRDAVWTARDSAGPVAEDFRQPVMDYVDAEIKEGRIDGDARPRIADVVETLYARGYPEGDLASNRRWDADTGRAVDKLRELVTRWRIIEPGSYRLFRFEGLTKPESAETAVQVRFRARAMPLPMDEKVTIHWIFVDPDDPRRPLGPPTTTDGRAGDLLQFLFRGTAAIRDGRAAILVQNGDPITGEAPEYHVTFEGDNWLEIMYKVDTFEANFLRNILLLLSRLAFLSAVGLTFGVFVSFPVACLCTFVVYLVGIGWNWWYDAIGADVQVYSVQWDPYGRFGPFIRFFLEPLMIAFPNFVKYDGTSGLIAGELIANNLVLQAVAHTLLFGALLLLVIGWIVFQRKEIAEVQV
jgi:ABC-type transport system involved in multi-copper enzyme maturation permease subunit